MAARKCTLGGLPAIEVVDGDGYKSVWQKRSRRLTPIKRSYKGRAVNTLPGAVYDKHLGEVREVERKGLKKETKQTPSQWSKQLVPAARGFVKQHPQD